MLRAVWSAGWTAAMRSGGDEVGLLPFYIWLFFGLIPSLTVLLFIILKNKRLTVRTALWQDAAVFALLLALIINSLFNNAMALAVLIPLWFFILEGAALILLSRITRRGVA